MNRHEVTSMSGCKVLLAFSVMTMLILPSVSLPADSAGPMARSELSRANASFWGEHASDSSGNSVACAGDVNGDGYDDVLIGAPNDDQAGTDAGKVYLFFGKASGWSIDTSLASASASFLGENPGDRAGHSVAGAGDVNGDGYDDFLVGAPNAVSAGQQAGKVYLVFGRTVGWVKDTSLSSTTASFFGEITFGPPEHAGSSVAGAGDVNGDGYDDILIGAPYDSELWIIEGEVHLVFGKSTGWARNVSLSTAAASFLGEPYLNPLTGAPLPVSANYAGWSIAGAGDVNGDGYDDILIGAYNCSKVTIITFPITLYISTPVGKSYLILGKTSGWARNVGLAAASSASYFGEASGDRAGWSVAGTGDVDGDGYVDFLVGAPRNDQGGAESGQVYLIKGMASGWAKDLSLSAASASYVGGNANDELGTSVAGAGDIDRDGYDDFLIGAPWNDDSGVDAGKAYLLCGKPAGWAMDTPVSNANTSFLGETTDDYAGYSLGGGGDLNGDGYSDIVIGAVGDDEAGTDAGQTYLIFPFAEPPAPSEMEAWLSRTGGPVTLDWNAPCYCPYPLEKYRVYRSEEYGEPRLLGSVPTWRSSYVDANVEIGNAYTYTIVAEYGSGGSSGKSCGARVLVEPDSDLDGMGNSIDSDDDGDGIPDELDAQPLVEDSTRWSRPDTDLTGFGTGFVGEDSSDSSGYSVAAAGDVNGDGYDDILIGAYGDDDFGPDAGQTYLLLGKASGWAPDTDLSNADASFVGEGAGDNSGSSVAGAGDVNGDGYDDILIGAYANDAGGADAGQAYLIFGKASGWTMDTNLSAASASFWGEDAGDWAGSRVAGAGDVNGDGYGDILIAAHCDDDGGTNAGQTHLIFGRASGWAMDTDLSAAPASFWGEDAFDYAATWVAGAGDINGDGYDDILIGAYKEDDGGADAGQIYIILGKASGWAPDTDLSNVDASFWGEDAGDNAGVAVASAGDVNGDGYDDILIGAFYDGDGGALAGQTYLILGRASGWAMDRDLSSADASFWGEDAGDESGFSVRCAGDVNGDGYDDILIGARYDDDGGADAGQTYLILGKASGWAMDRDLSSADASFWGEDAGDNSGTSVAGVGDVNGDGYDDILIGAIFDDDGGANAGRTYLINRTVLSQVQGLSLNLTSAMTGFQISWTKDHSAPCFYGIYRGAAPDRLYRLATTTVSNYADTNITAGVTYYYSVTAVGPLGEESPIAPAKNMVADLDTDGDGQGNLVDSDDDNDGTPDGQDMFPLNSTEKTDTDFDGIGNNADTDDDNDGIPDASDPEPQNPLNSVIYQLNYANTTLQNVQGTVNALYANLAMMEGNLTGLATGFMAANISLTNMMNGLRMDITAFNLSFQGRLDNVLVDMAGLNISVQGNLDGVGANLSGLNASMQNALNGLDGDITGLNLSQQDRMTTLGNAMGHLSAKLDEVNASLNAEISALSAEMDAFRNEMNAGLQEILGLLKFMDANLTGLGNDVDAMTDSVHSSTDGLDSHLAGQIQDLATMIQDLNATTLSELRKQLGELRSSMEAASGNESGKIMARIDTLNGVLGGFQSSTNGRFNNISVQMAKLDGVKSDLGKLQEQQNKTGNDAGHMLNLSYVPILLIIVLLALAGGLIAMSGRKNKRAAMLEATPIKE
jgi:outer membrane murein-binding lipoprotein Lpp